MKKEVKIGLAGIVALVLLFLGINFLKGVNLFTTNNTYYIRFDNAKGLSKSSTVYADGYNVGIVSSIIYDYDNPGQVLVEISTDRSLRIPKGSTATLDEAMLGGCTLNMKLATNLTEAYHPGDTIQGSDASGLMSKAADIMPQLEQVVAKVGFLRAFLTSTIAAMTITASRTSAGSAAARPRMTFCTPRVNPVQPSERESDSFWPKVRRTGTVGV